MHYTNLFFRFSVPFRLVRPELITYDRSIVIRDKDGNNVTGNPFTPPCSEFELRFVRNFLKSIKINQQFLLIKRGKFRTNNINYIFYPDFWTINQWVCGYLCIRTRVNQTLLTKPKLKTAFLAYNLNLW